MCTNTNHTCLPLCIKSKHENPYDFFHTRNSQAIQEGILLGLLNQHFDIVIEAPQKKSVVTLNYYTIIHLYNSSEYINFTNTLTNKLKEMMSEDIARNTPRGTAERRKEMNRIAESIHQLMFILQNQGYSLKTTSQGKVNSRQMVKEIMYEGIIYNEKDINEKGKCINNILADKMSSLKRKDTFMLKQHDLEILNALFS